MQTQMPSLTFPFTFLQLSKTGEKLDLFKRRDRDRVVPPAARHPDLWGDRRGNIAVLPPRLEPRSTGFGRDRLLHLQEIFRMNYENQILDALMIVSAWDIPDEDFADAVNDQAMLMAGVDPDDIPERHPDTH